MANQLAEIRRSMLDINKFLFGFISKGYAYMDYIVSTPSRDEIPFYFSSKETIAPYIYQAGKNQMNVIDKQGMVQRQGLNISLDEEDHEPEELVKFISDYWPTYLELMTKENPRKFKEDYQKLLDFCSDIGDYSYLLFTEKTTFIFPRNLLNTFRAFIYSGYENCGTIAVSKLRKKPGKITEIEETYLKYNYEVFIRADEEASCQMGLMEGGVIGEIDFHTHPFNILDQSQYIKLWTQFQKDKNEEEFFGNIIGYYLSITDHCFSNPSNSDLNFVRYKLFTGVSNIVLIICYHGIYLFKLQKLIKDIYIKKEVSIMYLTESELKKYEKPAISMSSNIIANKFTSPLEMERYHKLYDSIHLEKSPLVSTEDEQFFYNYQFELYRQIQKHLINHQDINSRDNYKSLLKGFYKPAIEYTQRLTKKVLEKVINYRNDTGNKIIAEFIPVKYNQEKDIFEYPEFSVEVYPRLLKERRAMAPRRLTIQQ